MEMEAVAVVAMASLEQAAAEADPARVVAVVTLVAQGRTVPPL